MSVPVPPTDLELTNLHGCLFRLLLVQPGERYGAKAWQQNTSDAPLIEFYELRGPATDQRAAQGRPPLESGYFIARETSRLLRTEDNPLRRRMGIALASSVAAWRLSPANLAAISRWLDAHDAWVAQQRARQEQARRWLPRRLGELLQG